MAKNDGIAPAKSIDVFMDRFRSMYSGHEDEARDVFRRCVAYQLGLVEENRPIAAYMCVGPSGSGKSFFWEAVAKSIHGPDGGLLCIDGGEYQHSHEIAKLVGSPPGYLGHRETKPIFCRENIAAARGQSQIAVNFILVDEVDKCSDAMQMILLGSLEKGKIKTGDNTTVLMNDCFFAFTANSGKGKLYSVGGIGLTTEGVKKDLSVRGSIKDGYSLPFLGRIDKFMLFNEYTEHERAVAINKQIIAMITKFGTSAPQSLDIDVGFFEAAGKTPLNKDFGMRDLVKDVKGLVRERCTDLVLCETHNGKMTADDWATHLEQKRESSKVLRASLR